MKKNESYTDTVLKDLCTFSFSLSTFNIFPWFSENVISKEFTFSPRNYTSWIGPEMGFLASLNSEWTPDVAKESLLSEAATRGVL